MNCSRNPAQTGRQQQGNYQLESPIAPAQASTQPTKHSSGNHCSRLMVPSEAARIPQANALSADQGSPTPCRKPRTPALNDSATRPRQYRRHDATTQRSPHLKGSRWTTKLSTKRNLNAHARTPSIPHVPNAQGKSSNTPRLSSPSIKPNKPGHERPDASVEPGRSKPHQGNQPPPAGASDKLRVTVRNASTLGVLTNCKCTKHETSNSQAQSLRT